MIPSKADAMKAVGKKYTERILLQRPNLVDDDRGGKKPGEGGRWLDVEMVWGKHRKTTVATEIVAGAVASVVTRETEIHYRDDITNDWRALIGDTVLKINHVYGYGRENTIFVSREVIT